VGVAPVIGNPGVGGSGGGTSVVGGGTSVVGGGTSVVGGGTSVVGGGEVSVGVGKGVFVGGIGVFVGIGVGGIAVLVGSGLGRRVLVGPLSVGNAKITLVLATMAVGVGGIVFVGVNVGVEISSGNASMVMAAAVFKLLTAESNMLCGSMTTGADAFKSWIAIPETEHNRLIPTAPATKTARSPRYSLIFTIVALLSTARLSH